MSSFTWHRQDYLYWLRSEYDLPLIGPCERKREPQPHGSSIWRIKITGPYYECQSYLW